MKVFYNLDIARILFSKIIFSRKTDYRATLLDKAGLGGKENIQ